MAVAASTSFSLKARASQRLQSWGEGAPMAISCYLLWSGSFWVWRAMSASRLVSVKNASAAYLERCGRRPLREYDWLGFEDSLGHLRSARWISANLSDERIVLRADSLLALRSAAAAGFGVAALPCYLGDPSPALRRIRQPLPEMEGSLWLLTHPDLRRVTRIRAVLDSIAHCLGERRALIEG